MTRILALVGLALFSAGCTRYQSAPGGPFAKPKKEPPPPYGSIAQPNLPNKPVGGQSPLGMASAEPSPPLPPDERPLIPPRPSGVLPAGGSTPITVPASNPKYPADGDFGRFWPGGSK
jgi:hypothetical protein